MAGTNLSKLSRRERQIMDILFEHGECSAQNVLDHLADPPSYSSIRALIARLVEKGFVTYRMEGARHIYIPCISESKAQDSALKRLLKIFFKGSRIQALSALLDMDGAELTETELNQIERKIKHLKKIKK